MMSSNMQSQMMLIKYACTNDVMKYAITNDVIKYAITNDVINMQSQMM